MASDRSALERLRSHTAPEWWRDAKLGIFIHWTPASVPAYAPTSGDYGNLLTSGDRQAFAESPYVEWYENSLRFPNSSASRHHRQVWGERTYRSFGADFERGLEQWDPEGWAARFAEAGAGYVVLVSKHMDGWCLWPSEVPNPHVAGWHTKRDVVGELAEAVRGRGMRFGLYYSGGLDSTFRAVPMGTMGGVINGIPRRDYPAYAEAQVRELIARYRPSVLWNDIAWPTPGRELWPLLAHYYEAVPEGVINDRWMPWTPLFAAARTGVGRNLIDAAIRRQTSAQGGLVPPRPPHCDYRTPEYTTFDKIQSFPWECVRGMDHSFGYNAESTEEDFLGHDELLWTLTDIAAKGGNLLLNVGPRGVDAQIPPEQLRRLEWLAGFVPSSGPALVGSRPWTTPGSATAEGEQVRYTTSDGRVFAFIGPGSPSATLLEVTPTGSTSVTRVGGGPLEWEATPGGIRLQLDSPGSGDPVVVALDQVTAAAT